MDVKIEESWKVRLQTEFEKPYFKTLTDFVRNEYQQTTIFPLGNLSLMPSIFVRSTK